MRKLLTLLLWGLVCTSAVAQHTLQRVDMQVVLRKDGSANVTERRQVQVGTAGTEGYIAFNDTSDIEVCDLQVSDDQNVCYVVEDEWNTERSRADKKGRCGYHHTSQGVELCWGLGDAGERTYEIRYTLTKLVKAYTDFDGFCHSFYEAGNTPAEAFYLEISSETDSLTRDNAAIWTFGYDGYKGLADGVCVATADDPMSVDDAIIVLLQLQKGVLDPVAAKEESFTETVKREALIGSDYDLDDAGLGNNVSLFKGDGEQPEVEPVWFEPDYGLLGGALVIIVFIVTAFMVTARDKKRAERERQRIAQSLSQLMGGKTYDELPYYRNLPLDGNLLLSGATLGAVDTMARKSGSLNLNISFGLQQLYEAFILRMFYKDHIKVQHVEEQGKLRKRFYIGTPVQPEAGDDVTDVLTIDSWSRGELRRNEAIGTTEQYKAKLAYKGYINDAGIEYYLHKLLYDAAGDDHLLQPEELKNYVKENPLEWRPFATILNMLTARTIAEKNLQQDNVQQVVGFLRYLRDFSLVAERHLEETQLWREYLVFASFYGIADQVRRDMKKVAPDVVQLDQLVPPENVVQDFTPLTEAIVSTVVFAHAYLTEKEQRDIERARYRESVSYERSSGGSGSSSRGGGGGHSGGGGSGFR